MFLLIIYSKTIIPKINRQPKPIKARNDKQIYIFGKQKIFLQLSMLQSRLALNPELQMIQSRSSLFKNDQTIGKIYSKKQLTIMRESSDSLNLKSNTYPIHFKQQILLGAESPLAQVNRLHFQFDKFAQEHCQDPNNKNSSVLEISPVTNKSFRINKLYSSEMSNFANKKKTPQLIGKLSTSKLNNKEIYSKQSQTSFSKGNSKNRSPGHLTQRKHLRRGAKQQILPINSPQVSRFMQFIDQNLVTSQQLSQTQLNPQNQRLLRQVKQKQQYLKQMIERRRKAGSQQPVPRKSIQQFKYNYPVSKNSQRANNNNKKNPYLQKIQQNSRLFQGSLMSPRFLTKVKQATTKPSNEIRKNLRFNDSEQVLQKSRNKQMKISPEVNVSFTIKSPRRSVQGEDNNKTRLQVSAQNEVQQWKENLSRVSLYSPEKNINFNNRKPKFVSMLIDPSKHQLQPNSQEKSQQKISDQSSLSKHFSRFLKQTSPQAQLQPTFITLKTPISFIKQLLIQSGPTSFIHFSLPSCIFNNTQISPTTQIRQLHLFIQKVYNQMRIRPEIVTIKRYKNAIFTGVFQSSTKEFNFFTAIIYHFTGQVYIGGWKESRSPFDMHKDKVDGCKQGIGMEIIIGLNKKMEENTQSNNEQKNQNSLKHLTIDLYYGQFLNNKRHGYGIALKAKSVEFNLQEELTEIGCWKEGQKNGWTKIYKNNKLESNAEYQSGKKLRQLALRGQTELNKVSAQN